MKILYISYDGMTDPLGQSQVIPYLEGLTKLGHTFWILSCEKATPFLERKANIQQKMDDAGINWHPIKYHASPPVLSTIADIRKLIGTSAQLIEDEGIDVVHCRSYIAALVGVGAKKKFGVKFVFDMRGFWADERIEGNIWSLSNPIFKLIYRYFKSKELQYFSLADYTISLTENGKREIHSWPQIKNNPIPIQVIPCCADLELFSPTSPNEQLRNELGIKPESLVISYLGSIGTWYLLDEMLHFFSMLLQRKPDATFLFITGDSPESIFSKSAHYAIPADRIVVRKANREEVPQYLSICRLSIFFIKQSFSKKASSPTKMGEIMGMGIPIICNDGVGDVGEIMSSVNPGAVITTFDENSYTIILDNLENILAEDPENIRQSAKKYYALQEGISRYHHVYSNLTC